MCDILLETRIESAASSIEGTAYLKFLISIVPFVCKRRQLFHRQILRLGDME